VSDLDVRLSQAWQEIGYWRQASESLKEELRRSQDEVTRLRAAMSVTVEELYEVGADDGIIERLDDARYGVKASLTECLTEPEE
jgi:hypothetical protein